MDIDQIRNRLQNGYYLKFSKYIHDDVAWLIQQFEEHIDELHKLTQKEASDG